MMTQHTKKHPSLVYYGENTLVKSFPLLLVVGREPQVDEEVAKGIGSYDFVAHPRCAFWNVAHSMLARGERRAGFGTAALKREFVQLKASPIVFADALPICLSNKNNARDKLLQRSQTPEEAIVEHVNGIFDLDLMSRVALVILSGHQPAQFRHATTSFQEHLKSAGKPFIETAFFYPTNSQKIEAQIEQANGWKVLQSVLAEFRNHT
jgi:hypothetical protein